MGFVAIMSVVSVVAMVILMPVMSVVTVMSVLVVLVFVLNVVSMMTMMSMMTVVTVVSLVVMVSSMMFAVLVLPELVCLRGNVDTSGFLVQFHVCDRSIPTITLGVSEARRQGNRGCQSKDKAFDLHV